MKAWPARHETEYESDANCAATTKKWDGTDTAYSHCPAMGQRFRLSAEFDETAPLCFVPGGTACETKDLSQCDCSVENGYFSAANQKILRAIKKYGLILADGGSSWYITGAYDPRWDNDDLHNLGLVWGGWMQAVNETSLVVNRNSFATGAEPPTLPTPMPTLSPTVSSSSPTTHSPTTKPPTKKMKKHG